MYRYATFLPVKMKSAAKHVRVRCFVQASKLFTSFKMLISKGHLIFTKCNQGTGMLMSDASHQGHNTATALHFPFYH